MFVLCLFATIYEIKRLIYTERLSETLSYMQERPTCCALKNFDD